MVLLVDDNQEWRETVREYLALHGYIVQSAANGSEALELSKRYQTPPELILLDLNMPILDGWDFLPRGSAIRGSQRFRWWLCRHRLGSISKPSKPGRAQFCKNHSRHRLCFV